MPVQYLCMLKMITTVSLLNINHLMYLYVFFKWREHLSSAVLATYKCTGQNYYLESPCSHYTPKTYLSYKLKFLTFHHNTFVNGLCSKNQGQPCRQLRDLKTLWVKQYWPVTDDDQTYSGLNKRTSHILLIILGSTFKALRLNNPLMSAEQFKTPSSPMTKEKIAT